MSFFFGWFGVVRVEVAVGQMREELGSQEGFGPAGVDAGSDGEGSELGELACVEPRERRRHPWCRMRGSGIP